MDDELLTKLKWLIDRTEIFDLVRYERFCRDQRDWKGLIDSFVPNSRVRTTWFDGPVEEFADASRRKMTGADASVAKHWIGAGHFLTVLNWRAPIDEVARAHELFGRETIP
jgi:hypothetical protein